MKFLPFLIILTLFCVAVFGDRRGKRERQKWNRYRAKERPNIIFILADDLDVLLGTPEVMSKTRKILKRKGIEFNNAFVTTPLCCPSRSSILTGRYVHNHNVHSNNKNCSSQAWRQGPEKQNFGTFLQTAGYKTGYFGKYLNDYDGSYIPPGWNRWIGLIKNSRFYNYTLNNNGQEEYHGADYNRDYFTNVITDKGIRFFRKEKRLNRKQPLMMVISMAAPHGPEDPAPQYQHLFKNVKAPRTPNYNYTAKDRHWIVRISKPLDKLRGEFTDLLHRRRLLTMLSLDDNIERLVTMLKEIKELDNTYIFFSSDHGFHIGQFNLLKGKSQPYETDIRVPLYVRGPGVKRNKRINKIALNIDLAPTFLDIAGVKAPPFMDGTSLLPLLRSGADSRLDENLLWRDTFLVQRGSMVVLNNTLTYLKYNTKGTAKKAHWKASLVCGRTSRPMPPCTKWKRKVCVKINGKYFLKACPARQESFSSVMTENMPGCRCEHDNNNNSASISQKPMSVKYLKLKKRVVNSRQLYQLIKSGSVSIDKLREAFSRELARIKRKYRRRSLRYLRHLRNDKILLTKMKRKQLAERNVTATSFRRKIEKIDRKIVDARKRLDALRERKRLLKVKKPTAIPSTERQTSPPSVKETPRPLNCICEPKWKRRRKTKQKKSKKLGLKAAPKNMKCYFHSKDHWKTPPFWTREAFRSCKNSPNNTFWCLRKINETHNFIYCEFVTSYVEYYDLNKDPYQLENSHRSLLPSTILEFKRQLTILRNCMGTEKCTMTNGKTMAEWKDVLANIEYHRQRSLAKE